MGSKLDETEIDGDLLAARVAASRVSALDGRSLRLREHWRAGPTVNVFVRQFGCVFCHQMVNDVVAAVPEVVERGGHVVIVGNGTVEQARGFFRSKDLPRPGVTVLTDVSRDAYRAAGFERGLARTFLHGGARQAYSQAKSQGHRITGWFGDLTQLGGVMVIRPPASLVYLHRSRYAGDHPDVTALLEAIGSKTAGAA